MYEIISGGVTAAQGFSAGATRCGIKASSQKDDTAIIFSEIPCTAAAVYTKNRVKASPIQVTRDHLANQVAQAVIVNSGNANACAPDGMENARRMAKVAAKVLGVDEDDVVVASTGVIGQRLPVECIEQRLVLLGKMQANQVVDRLTEKARSGNRAYADIMRQILAERKIALVAELGNIKQNIVRALRVGMGDFEIVQTL